MRKNILSTGLVIFAVVLTLAFATAVDARERGERDVPHRDRDHQTTPTPTPTPEPEPEPTPPYLDPIFITKDVLERWKAMLEEGNLEDVISEYEYYIENGGQLPPEEEENTGDEEENGEDGNDGSDGSDGEVGDGEEGEEGYDDPRRGPRTREINRTRGGDVQEDNTTPQEEEMGGDEEDEQNPTPEPTGDLSYLELVAHEINRLTNVERESLGLEPFVVDPLLEDLAEGHSGYMANTGHFSHTQIEGENDCDLTCRLENKEYIAQSWGENIAWRSASTFPEAEELAVHFLRGWINSDGHRDNILSSDFNKTGIGLAQIGNTIFATADFAETID